MSENSVEKMMKGNIKLSVFDSFPYGELRKICDLICGLGYECEIVSNGNFVFNKVTTIKVEGLPKSIQGIVG